MKPASPDTEAPEIEAFALVGAVLMGGQPSFPPTNANLPLRTYRRGSQLVRPFRPEEDALITELRVLGMGTTEIAKFLFAAQGSRRSPATINMRLKSLAARDEDEGAP
jgi:hypothetical protein